jgi:hypothetical protein
MLKASKLARRLSKLKKKQPHTHYATAVEWKDAKMNENMWARATVEGVKPTLTVSNIAQKIAFCCEMQSQISNGYWEHAHPAGHYKDWMLSWDQVIAISPIGTSGIYHFAKRNYNLTNKTLLDIVGPRLRFRIALAKVWPSQTLPLLATDSWSVPTVEDYNCWVGQSLKASGSGIPPTPAGTSDYYQKKLMVVAKAGITFEMLDEVNSHLDSLYSHKQLRDDLKALKQAIRTCKERT